MIEGIPGPQDPAELIFQKVKLNEPPSPRASPMELTMFDGLSLQLSSYGLVKNYRCNHDVWADADKGKFITKKREYAGSHARRTLMLGEEGAIRFRSLEISASGVIRCICQRHVQTAKPRNQPLKTSLRDPEAAGVVVTLILDILTGFTMHLEPAVRFRSGTKNPGNRKIGIHKRGRDAGSAARSALI